MDNLAQDTLSAEEEAFFSSGGEQKPQELPPEPSNPEPKPEPQKADEQVAQPAADDTKQERDDKGRFVPHQALHAEREERKKWQAEAETFRRELNEHREWRGRIEERFKASQAPQEPVGPPDPNEDIFGALKWTQEQLQKSQTEQSERLRKQEEERAASEQDTAIWREWQTDALSYAEENKDFGQAAAHLAEQRDRQLQALALADQRFADKAFRDQVMNDELRGIIVAAREQGKRPAEMIFDIAQKGYGYQAKPAEAPQLSLTEKLRGVDAAQAASRSLGQASGRSSGDPVSLDSIANMPEAEFNQWINNASNKAMFDKLMGASS